MSEPMTFQKKSRRERYIVRDDVERLHKKDIFMAGADKKVISGSFRIDLNSRTKSRRRRAYHQNEVLHITKAKALYIIIAKEDAACG